MQVKTKIQIQIPFVLHLKLSYYISLLTNLVLHIPAGILGMEFIPHGFIRSLNTL